MTAVLDTPVLSVDTATLVRAVTDVALTLPTRPPVPILAGIIIETDQDGLHLSAFDYEFDYETSTRVTVIGDPLPLGRALVNGRSLAGAVKAHNKKRGQYSTLTVTSAGVTVAQGASQVHLNTMPAEEYPTLPSLGEHIGQITVGTLTGIASRAIVAAGKDDTLPVLTGVRLELHGDGTAAAAATDRYRLSAEDFTWFPAGDQPDIAPLIPASMLKRLIRQLKGTNDSITVDVHYSAGHYSAGEHYSEGQIGFSTDRITITQRLLDGEFPKYRKLLPDHLAISTMVERESFLAGLNAVAHVCDRNQPVRLEFNGDTVTFHAGVEDNTATAKAPLILPWPLGEAVTIAFNPVFTADAVKSQPSDIVDFGINNSLKPAVFSSGDFTYLLMPVRING